MLEQALPRLDRLIYRLDKLLALLVLAKKLFADEEHSNAEAVSLYVLVMPIAGADLLAILDRIAAEGHSGAVTVSVFYLILCQTDLYQLYDIGLREEPVGATLYVLL